MCRQGTFCNEHTYQCFLTDVHAACCDEGGLNCPGGQDIPNTCPVGWETAEDFLEFALSLTRRLCG